MEGLEAYRLTKSDYYTHCWDLPPQLGGCVYEDGSDQWVNAIDGEAGVGEATGRRSWSLPLAKDNGGVEPDWAWIPDDVARREAVERLSHNRGPVSKFATRGAGKGGFPPVSAPLADPNARGEEDLAEAVSAAMAATCYRILGMEEEAGEVVKALGEALGGRGSETAERVRASLVYLRDRVGVPRDMTLPAARWTRATLNSVIDEI